MNFYDALDIAIERRGLTQTKVCELVGRSAKYISNSKARGSAPRIDNAAMLFGAAGYRLYAIPEGDEVPELAIEVTHETQDEKDERVMERVRKLEEQAEKLRKKLGR